LSWRYGGWACVLAQSPRRVYPCPMKSVLVVDDEPNIVLSLEFLMKQAGYEVRVARDGDAALAAFRDRAPDLVLLDVMMPGKGGYELCQTIRANPAWDRTKVVMLTAKIREVEREKG